MAIVSRRRAEWSDLRMFWAVAELGGFGAAARALGVSQSTITRRIDELEYRLNARLFVRRPQGVALTDAGRDAIDHVRTMEHAAEAFENLILDTEDRPEGGVGIAAPDGVAGIFMAPFVAEFLRANPKIDLRFDCGLWPDHPLKGDADISLTFAEPTQSDLIACPIAHFHYALFAARSYLDLYGAPSSLPEGVSHAYVHHAAQIHQPERWHPQSAAFRDMAGTRLETNSSAVSFSTVKHGVGIGLMPTAILALEPTLVMLDTPQLGRLRLWLTYHRDIGKAARIRRVIDWMREVFDPKAKPWYREEFVHPRDFMHLVPGSPPFAEPPRPAGADKETGPKVALRAR
jgi:DNA-binding transcriptional LysR family regulator